MGFGEPDARDCQTKFLPHPETSSMKQQEPVSFEQPLYLPAGLQHWQPRAGTLTTITARSEPRRFHRHNRLWRWISTIVLRDSHKTNDTL